MPVTIPDIEPTVATPGVPELHVPPGIGELKVAVNPTHKIRGALDIVGFGLTVSIATAWHPAGDIYVIIVVPAEIPSTTPEVDPIVATPGILLLQVPPDAPVGAAPVGVIDKVTVDPTHTGIALIVGVAFTVIVNVA